MGKSMLQSIKKSTRSKVRDILMEYPETRNSDRLLRLTYWTHIDGVTSLDDLMTATCPESIRRARQWWNERGFLLATDTEVLKRRKQFNKEMKKGITKL